MDDCRLFDTRSSNPELSGSFEDDLNPSCLSDKTCANSAPHSIPRPGATAKTPWQFDTPADSDQDLEHQITTLFSTIAASDYRVLCLLAEFDRRSAWAGDGTRSCAHWLNWRCGIGMNASREKIRVAHALPKLPKISEAFSKGHLSYSKVRAMTRIATPDNEDILLVIGEFGTASHLENLARIYRRCETPEELEQERHASNQRHYTRTISHYWDEEGSLVIKASLPPEQGAVVLKALEAATELLRREERFDPWQGVEAEAEAESEADSAAESATEPKTEPHSESQSEPQPESTPVAENNSAETPSAGSAAAPLRRQQHVSAETHLQQYPAALLQQDPESRLQQHPEARLQQHPETRLQQDPRPACKEKKNRPSAEPPARSTR